MMSKTYTTREAAEAVGISRATLQDWIKKGKYRAPKLLKAGKGAIRFWTDSDVARLKVAKTEIYQEQDHRPKK